MQRLWDSSNVGSAATGAVGSVVEEGRATPVNKMSIASGKIAAQKADALIVLSREVLENSSSAAAQSFVNRQLRRAIAKALDVGIADSLTKGIAAIPATANADDDLKALLDAVTQARDGWLGLQRRMSLIGSLF